MTQTVLPIQLLARISDVTSKEHQRHAIFTISTDNTSPKRIFSTFRADLKKLGISADHTIVWFRCGALITVLVSGAPAITNYAFAFVAKAKSRKLFDSGDVLFEGVSTHKFKAEVGKLLRQYTAPTVKHSFGGSN